jgi:hypothetical protein
MHGSLTVDRWKYGVWIWSMEYGYGVWSMDNMESDYPHMESDHG